MTALRTHDQRRFAEAGPSDCPARHGGMVGYWLCELPRCHAGWHRDTEGGGRAWAWEGMDEIAGCTPEGRVGLTGHYEHPGCSHG